MPSRTVTLSSESEMDLTSRVMAIEEINKFPTDMLKRLVKLSKNEKAQSFLSSETKFTVLQVLLKKL